MKTFLLTLAGVFAFPFLSGAKEKAPLPDKIFISREAAKALLDADGKMYPDKGSNFYKLEHAFGKHDQYTVAQVLAIRDGAPKDIAPGKPKLESGQTTMPPSGKPPRDAWTRAQVEAQAEALEKIDPQAKGIMKRLDERVPGAKWYTTAQVLNAEQVKKIEDPKPEDLARYEVLTKAYEERLDGEARARQGLRWPRIRRDWRDVLYDEDQSQAGNSKKAISDLEGALISYVHDGKADSDTWNAHGALIVPITFDSYKDNAPFLWRLAAAPSVTYDRVSTNGNPGSEVDKLAYRLGVYGDFYDTHRPKETYRPGSADPYTGEREVNPTLGYGVQVRAAGVYITDQDHHSGLSGFEVDVEPRLQYGKAALGYQSVLWEKKPAKADGSDNSFLTAQLRTWLHIEGGDVQDAGPGWAQVKNSFFRLGPTVEFQLVAPALPGDRTLSFTAVYSYLGAISGPNERPSYLRTTLAYDLFRNVNLNQKISLNVSYERGGLNFTKQQVDTLTVGLGVLF